MADIVLINPRFEFSYWGMEFALPFLESGQYARGLPAPAGGADARLHTVTLIDENVEAFDWDRWRDRYRWRDRHERATVPHEGDPDRAETAGGLLVVVGGPWVTVQEDYFGDLADVIFVGEAEELGRSSWRMAARTAASRYEQAEKTDMSQGADAAIRSAENAPITCSAASSFPEAARSMRVLRHHRHLRPPAPASRPASGACRAGGSPQPESHRASSWTTI